MPIQTAETRRLQQRTEARRAILDSTEALLVESGYDQFSMRKLAARCGYTAPTIYHYFGDKNRLLDVLLDLHVSELLADLRALPRSEDPADDIRAHFFAIARWGLANPTHYQLMTTARAPGAPPLPSGEQMRAILERPIDELAVRGRLRGEPETARQSFWVLLHGIVSLQRLRPDVAWSEDLLEHALDAMLRGALLSDCAPTRSPR